MKMKTIFFFLLSGLPLTFPMIRKIRAAYDLPAGYKDVLIDDLKTTFKCTNDGYYADVANNCQVFHICHSVTKPNGRTEMLQWSFFCGNLTIFNQATLTCTYPGYNVFCGKENSYNEENKKLLLKNVSRGNDISDIPESFDTVISPRQRIPFYRQSVRESPHGEAIGQPHRGLESTSTALPIIANPGSPVFPRTGSQSRPPPLLNIGSPLGVRRSPPSVPQTSKPANIPDNLSPQYESYPGFVSPNRKKDINWNSISPLIFQPNDIRDSCQNC